MRILKSLFIGGTLLLSSASLLFAGNGDTLKAVKAKGFIQAGVNGDLFGFGKADKKAVDKMTRLQLNLSDEKIIDDAMDALAIVLTHGVSGLKNV